MNTKILYILPSYNKFGGTPKKTLDLIKYSTNTCYLYVWTNTYAAEFKQEFVDAGACIYEGVYGRNIFKHIFNLLKIIKRHKIDIIQSQFFFGELLSNILKILKPQLKLVIAFVGAISPTGYKKRLLKLFYHRVDAFVYISNYVRSEKVKAFPSLDKARGEVIYNGTNKPYITLNNIESNQDKVTILCVSGLSKIKNVQILIDCMDILLKKGYDQVQFLVAGDGPERASFEIQIQQKKLSNNFILLGYQKNIGNLYKKTNIFVHPCYVEGFGIAVVEAMLEEKPIIVANAGAMPELVNQNKTGLLVDPFVAKEWADAIIKFINNPDYAKTIATNAKQYAETYFTVKQFVDNYNKLYKALLN